MHAALVCAWGELRHFEAKGQRLFACAIVQNHNWTGFYRWQVELNLTSKAFRIKWEVVYPKAAKYSLLATVICLVQLFCLFRQLHYTETPAAAARVSILCIGQQAVLDAVVCVVHLMLCAFLPQLFTAFASVAFFKLVIFIIVEMRYIVVISHSRDPQRFFAGGINQLRQEWAMIHMRFYAILFLTLVLLYALQEHADVLVLIAHSYWVPQIFTNAVRESREPFHKHYIYGMSATRLFIPLYLYGCPQNLAKVILVAEMKPNYAMCLTLLGWTAVQIWLLHLQQKLGPRFMIPAHFLPPRYDYSRPLSRSLKDDLEAGEGDHECPICYQEVALVISRDERGYMLTPCDHIFHPQCLERWMQQKLECPVCRASLPPSE